MKNIKYILLSAILIGFTSCNEDDSNDMIEEPLPELTTGSADFSKYVSLGASFTAGYTDGALFKASQQSSFPNILAQQFAVGGGGAFTQPLMNDNYGGLAAGGTRIASPRLVFGGAGPVPLENVIGPVTVSTDILLNNPTGPFNNMGVPGAKSYHLLANGYGNAAGLPNLANPYFVRMTGATPNASMLDMATAQNPTFFTLSEIGGNDVLGYATTGGDGTNPITDTATFNAAFNGIVTALTANDAKGVVTNVPYITDLPHFTTVPHNPLSPALLGGATNINTLNAQLYGPLRGIFTAYGEPNRIQLLSTTSANPLLINDESAVDRSAEITAALTPTLGAPTAAAFGAIFGRARHATDADLFVLPLSSSIGTVVSGAPAPINLNGVSYPLADKWVLIPSEQTAIRNATDAYNATISNVASTNGLALVNLNAILTQASTTGIMFDDYTMNTSLVFGGLVSLDGIHLTARGYALMANKFLEAIDSTYGSNFIASGNVAKAGNYTTNFSPTLQ